jgi:hypothetical protein
VVVDGRLRISGLLDTPGPGPKGIRVSELLSAGLDGEERDKVLAFANLMRDPTTNRRIQPDIADLDTPATTLNDDWGWFEIKPMGNVRRAAEELWGYYLPRWNDGLAGGPHELASVGLPGAWQPATVFVTPAPDRYLFAAITVLPGAIGYLTFELENTAKAAVLTGLSVLAGLFLRRLLQSLPRGTVEAWVGARAVDECLAAWCVVVVGMVALFFAAEGLIVAGVLEGLEAAVARALERLAVLLLRIGS